MNFYFFLSKFEATSPRYFFHEAINWGEGKIKGQCYMYVFVFAFSKRPFFGWYSESTLYYFYRMQEGNGARVVIILSDNLGSFLFWKQTRLNTQTKLITIWPGQISLGIRNLFSKAITCLLVPLWHPLFAYRFPVSVKQKAESSLKFNLFFLAFKIRLSVFGLIFVFRE